MRIKTFVARALMAGVLVAGVAACGDDPEEASKLQEGCENSGFSEDTCVCYGETMSDEFSTDEINAMLEDPENEDNVRAGEILTDCDAEAGGGEESEETEEEPVEETEEEMVEEEE